MVKIVSTKTSAAPKAKAVKKPKSKVAKKPKIQAAQVRALKVLEKADDPMDCKKLSRAANFNKSWTTIHLGSDDEDVRERNDNDYFPSLVSLKYVRLVAVPNEDGTDRKVNAYQITASGRKVVERIRKSEGKDSTAPPDAAETDKPVE